MDFQHIPVLLAETIEALDVRTGGIYVDCTVGGAGHSAEIARRLGPEGRLIGFDQDDNALQAARERLVGCEPQVTLVKTNFEHIASVLSELAVGQVDGVLMDIGVSSHQLDQAERGFSYHQDAPLDMRMNRDNPVSAATVVNEWPEEQLAQVLWDYGEEKWSKRIAQFIVRRRETAPLATTSDLVDVIKAAIPARARRDKHPARRTFQAIRIAVNDELGVLERGLEGALQVLKPGGRLAVITFHSLEDRIVKQTFARWVNPCTCPSEIPVCVCGKKPLVKHVTRKPVTASVGELEANPRARSAKLRAVEKVLEIE